MSEVQQMVALAGRALAQGERLCLATVVHVEGSAYRKPGARMLLASGGERAGTISGGCLEAEVTRKAWWLTANGPRLERYSSFADEDGGMPYGLGCGGTVSLLLEQGAPAEAVLTALQRGIEAQQPAVVVTWLGAVGGIDAGSGLDGSELRSSKNGHSASHAINSNHGAPGTLAVLLGEPAAALGASLGSMAQEPALKPLYTRNLQLDQALAACAREVAHTRQSCFLGPDIGRWSTAEGGLPAYFVEYLTAPPSVTIFGAGDDAQPIAALAHALGWRVNVADGRAHLARRERFPLAAAVRVLDYEHPSLRASCGIPPLTEWRPLAPDVAHRLTADDLAVILTHSFEQDRALLAALLTRPMRYLGILGPRHRTERLLEEVAPSLGLTLDEARKRLHSPIGLDLGEGDPAAVALSIVAEIQAVLHGRSVTVRRSESELSTALPSPAEKRD